MSFATRCTACGTIFRVVQDQLRVSEGWVRCGRCAEVFDAREQLFDIDRDTPPVWKGDTALAMPMPMPQDGLASQAETETKAEAKARGATDPEANENFERFDLEGDQAPQEPVEPPGRMHVDASIGGHVRLEPQWVDEAGGAVEDSSVRPVDEPDFEAAAAEASVFSQHPAEQRPEPTMASMPPAVAGASGELPSFMRPSSAASRWHGPRSRVTVSALSLLLVVVLAGQLLLNFRDAIVAIYPQAATGLRALCQVSGCTVRPWRRIEVLSVENSALTQAGPGNAAGAGIHHYQLMLSLHNKSGVPVATPSIELSLLDASGVVVLRRVLNPADFWPDRPTSGFTPAIAPGADIPMRLQLTTGTQRISGYGVEIFHP